MMDLRYLDYMYDGYDYFVKLSRIKDCYKVEEFSNDTWETSVSEDGHWVQKSLIGQELPNQGWKIHISSNLKDAQLLLDKVSKVCLKEEVTFKYVKDDLELSKKNTKYADRGSSGKFITIYPTNVNKFVYLLEILHQELKYFENGPYILTDKRWKDGNVYFRYGGFKEIRKDGDNYNSYIKNGKGDLVVDDRSPYYKIPEGIEEPELIKQITKKYELNDSGSKLDDYNIVKAIHFSNGGGVYKALGIKDKKEYILKEGRLNAGWDRNNEDAFTRINNEYITLKKLSRVKEVVNVFDIFTEWESNFLVEEYIEGVPLTDWTASNFPFIKNNNNRNDYLLKVKKIMTNMIDVISTIHNNGLAIGDLQPNNIMVDKSLNIKLIDFEASKYVKSKQKLSLGTPGFLKDNLSTVEENDWHSLINILLYIFLPIGPVHSLNSSVIPKYIRHIKKIFGQTATNFISDFIDKCNLILEKNNYEKYQICTLDGNNLINIENIEDFSKKIVKTALKNLDFNELRPLKGDIRQFEYELGRYNYLTGIYGCIYALSKFIDIPNEWDEWILKHSNFSMNRDLGFFTGKSGIGMILYELGFTQQADSIFEDILLNLDDLEKLQDISMLSGYSGIGFSLVRYYKRTKKEVYFNKSLEIADYLIKLYKDKFDINYPFEDFGKVGIMTGWAGVAYYLLELYKINKLDYLLDYAKKCINYDLSKCKYDGKDGLYVDNNGILSPYLLGGSAGLALVILKFKSIGINDFNSQLEEIIKIIKSSNFYNIGLFRGALGILYIAAQCKNSSEDINNLVDILNIYLVTDGDNIYVPGEFSYKYSEDIFSGRAGLLLVLKELLNDKKNNLFEII